MCVRVRQPVCGSIILVWFVFVCKCRMRLYTHRWFLFLTFIQMHWNANKWFWNIKIILCYYVATARAPNETKNFVIAEKETFSKIIRLCECSCVVEFVECNTFQLSLSLFLCVWIRAPAIHSKSVYTCSQENKCRITYASIKAKRKRTENFPIHFARFMLTGVKTFQIQPHIHAHTLVPSLCRSFSFFSLK